MLIDSHCHLDRLSKATTEPQLDEIIMEANALGIGHILCVNVHYTEFLAMQAKVNKYDCVSLSVGIHPSNVQDGIDFDLLREYAAKPKVIAIGETGLDYHYQDSTKELQQKSFIEHISIAKEYNKPVIVHTRDAKADTLAILENENISDAGGILHCFTEDWHTAKKALDLGMYISISGIVTFKNAEELRSVVKQVPLDRLLVETDAPYLAPIPFRGKENAPAYVHYVAKYIAELKGISYDELSKITTTNFNTLMHTNFG